MAVTGWLVACGGGSRCGARTCVYCRARVMWWRASVAGVSVGAVSRVLFLFFQEFWEELKFLCL